MGSIQADGCMYVGADYPNECPLCHRSVTVAPIWAKHVDQDAVEAVFQCPDNRCSHLFIGYYQIEREPTTVDYPRLMAIKPTRPVAPAVHKEIAAFSPMFAHVLTQASASEALGLDQLAGMGYRKALEFLLKDWIIHGISTDQSLATEDKSTKVEGVKKKFLGTIIQDDIGDGRIKEMAKRAVWLGNDETHYVRKWEEKDVTDLKALLRLTTMYIESEIVAEQYLADMPQGRS